MPRVSFKSRVAELIEANDTRCTQAEAKYSSTLSSFLKMSTPHPKTIAPYLNGPTSKGASLLLLCRTGSLLTNSHTQTWTRKGEENLTNICPSCSLDAQETTAHLLFDCPTYQNTARGLDRTRLYQYMVSILTPEQLTEWNGAPTAVREQLLLGDNWLGGAAAGLHKRLKLYLQNSWNVRLNIVHDSPTNPSMLASDITHQMCNVMMNQVTGHLPRREGNVGPPSMGSQLPTTTSSLDANTTPVITPTATTTLQSTTIPPTTTPTSTTTYATPTDVAALTTTIPTTATTTSTITSTLPTTASPTATAHPTANAPPTTPPTATSTATTTITTHFSNPSGTPPVPTPSTATITTATNTDHNASTIEELAKGTHPIHNDDLNDHFGILMQDFRPNNGREANGCNAKA